MSISNLGLGASPLRNHVLGALTCEDLAALSPFLEYLQLKSDKVLLLPGEVVDYVYFIESGTVSMLAPMLDNAEIEVGLTGSEGIVGLPLLLGLATSNLKAIVQVEGSAYRIPAERFQAVLVQIPHLNRLLFSYMGFFYAQVTQTAACNGLHNTHQRLARWILMTADRVENDRFTMTQEFMARMLGVHRPGVTLAIGQFQRSGLVTQDRGRMRIIDRTGLEEVACQCYAIVRQQFDSPDHARA